MDTKEKPDVTRKITGYYPWWLDNMADDITGEGAAMQGVVHGAESVRTIVLEARKVYENQEFHFTGNYGDNDFIEEYTCQIQGEPTSVVVTVARNSDGRAAPRGEPPAAEFGAALRTVDGREVRRHLACAVLHN